MWIKLTPKSDALKCCFNVNMEHIYLSFEQDEGGTILRVTNGDEIFVKESQSYIEKLMEEKCR